MLKRSTSNKASTRHTVCRTALGVVAISPDCVKNTVKCEDVRRKFFWKVLSATGRGLLPNRALISYADKAVTLKPVAVKAADLSEDCLTINIFKPASIAKTARLPVVSLLAPVLTPSLLLTMNHTSALLDVSISSHRDKPINVLI